MYSHAAVEGSVYRDTVLLVRAKVLQANLYPEAKTTGELLFPNSRQCTYRPILAEGPQRAQYGLTKEYTLNHIINPNII